MNITLHIGSWITPFIITLIACAITGIIGYSERKDSGYLAGFCTGLAMIATILVTVAVWIVWAVTFFFSK